MSPSKKTAGSASLDGLVESTFEVSRAMRHEMERAMENREFNLLQFCSLMFIAEHDGATMSDLARQLHVASPTATAFITRLVRQGWVKRRHDRINRKLVRLSLTPKGKALLAAKMKDHQKVVRGILGLLSETELRQLHSLHQKLLERLARHSSR